MAMMPLSGMLKLAPYVGTTRCKCVVILWGLKYYPGVWGTGAAGYRW